MQLLVPQSVAASRGPQPAPSRSRSRDDPRRDGSPRRRERVALWQDSSFFQDSFFAPDNRLDNSLTGEASAFPSSHSDGPPTEPGAAYGDEDMTDVVVEPPEQRFGSTGTHH